MKNKRTGQELWQYAKTIIPGGNQLLSKKAERFLPGLWPSYYRKAKGCEIWDITANHYYDFAQLGVGSCVLGYADEDVNRAVIQAVNDGSMGTLNSYEEVELAEKLIDLHPWSDMARFARTGGEACSIAVRIARAATGKDKVAFCGYHGWHDWYVSANLSDSSNLDGQLLPGLTPGGVPRNLKGSAIPFQYNDIESFNDIIEKNGHEIGVIILEPVRGIEPKPGFLKQIREAATRIGAVLIFDEVTSGFRKNLGGVHLTYGVDPDMAVFGKALGNGFPISAIIGKKQVMEAAKKSFISSTMWTERIGFVAGIATIDKMIKNNVPSYLVKYGKQINNGWHKIAKNADIEIHVSGIEPLTHIEFNYENANAIQTLYAQEMLEKGYLLGSSVYTSFAYNEQIIDKFIKNSEIAFEVISKSIKNGNVENLLKGEVITSGFKRLNS